MVSVALFTNEKLVQERLRIVGTETRKDKLLGLHAKGFTGKHCRASRGSDSQTDRRVQWDRQATLMRLWW